MRFVVCHDVFMTTHRRGKARPLADVCADLQMPHGFAARSRRSTSRVADALNWLDTERPQGQNHWPALVLALVAQIETLLAREGKHSVPDVLSAYPPQVAVGGARAINTLNLTRPVGEPVRLREFYNYALNAIRIVMLREHPSNPGHATQSWPAYVTLIQSIASMDPSERREFAEQVWNVGVLARPARQIAAVQERAPRPFELVLTHLPTRIPRVRGGAILQALAYGYFLADSPNLILESHSVNTGSSRAGMLGDVDGFRGREPELAAEVKDLDITESDAEDIVSDFLEDIVDAPNATAVVVCASIDDAGRALIERRGVTVLSKADLVRTVAVWDVPKQEEALRGVEYYLGRIQKSERAVQFLRDWLADKGIDAGLGVITPTTEVAAGGGPETGVSDAPRGDSTT